MYAIVWAHKSSVCIFSFHYSLGGRIVYIRSQSRPNCPMLNIHCEDNVCWVSSILQNLFRIFAALTTLIHFVSNQNFSRQPMTKSRWSCCRDSKPATNIGQSIHLNKASSHLMASMIVINSRTKSLRGVMFPVRASKTRLPYMSAPALYDSAIIESIVVSCVEWVCSCVISDAQARQSKLRVRSSTVLTFSIYNCRPLSRGCEPASMSLHIEKDRRASNRNSGHPM